MWKIKNKWIGVSEWYGICCMNDDIVIVSQPKGVSNNNFTSDKINSTVMLLLDAVVGSIVCYGCMHFWIALRYCRKMTRTHTYEREKNSMQKKTERTNERERIERWCWRFFVTVSISSECWWFFHSISLCCLYSSSAKDTGSSTDQFTSIQHKMCMRVCVFGTCLISRFLFILIWFLFMLLKFIRCHAVDFTLMSEFRSSHSETDFKSVQCTLLALRVFKLYYLFNFTKKNFSWFDDDSISVCVSNPYQPNRNVEWQP